MGPGGAEKGYRDLGKVHRQRGGTFAIREVVPYMHEKRWSRMIGIQSTSVKEPVENIDLSNEIRPGIDLVLVASGRSL